MATPADDEPPVAGAAAAPPQAVGNTGASGGYIVSANATNAGYEGLSYGAPPPGGVVPHQGYAPAPGEPGAPQAPPLQAPLQPGQQQQASPAPLAATPQGSSGAAAALAPLPPLQPAQPSSYDMLGMRPDSGLETSPRTAAALAAGAGGYSPIAAPPEGEGQGFAPCGDSSGGAVPPGPPPSPPQPHMPPGADSGLRRNLPGTQALSMWKWSPRPIVHYSGQMALSEHIQDLLREDSSDVERIYELPSRDVDPLVWQYEHLRQFVIEFNLLLVALGEECTPETCPKMTASNEWQYLCAAHKKPQDCAAIDYMTHTIDGSTALLTNAKHFSTRTEVPQVNAKYFQSMARRLYRIFAHVFYHHRQIFDEMEAEMHLCARFSHFVMKFKLMSPSMLLVPQDAYEPKT